MTDHPTSSNSPPTGSNSALSASNNNNSSTGNAAAVTQLDDLSKSTSNPFADNDVLEEPRERSPQGDSPSVNLATRPTPQATVPPSNPIIAELKAMFPDYDEIVLQSILETANYDQGGAIEILLGMSDPNYKSEAPQAPQPAAALSQTDLDEQLARRLMLEEQEQQDRQAAVRWSQSGASPRRQNSRYGQDQPQNAAAQQHPHAHAAAGAAPGDKDTMAEIQEQLSKVAEVGKKTFGDIFTKVKAKIQEFEQGGSRTGSQPPSAQWIGGYNPQGYAAPGTYAQYHGAAHHPPARHGQASYYDPNPSLDSPITLSSSQSLSRTSPPRRSQSYDANAPHAPTTPPPPPATSSGPPTSQPEPASMSVPLPRPAGTPIDGGKLGLLPKRPVSLIRDPPSTQQQPKRRADSDDDLEYAENPFEDQRK